jgi:HD-like signal output (HDOD) protein
MGVLGALLKRTRADPRAELRRMVGDYELATFPASVMNALAMLRDPDCALGAVADELQMDPGVTVRVLRMVNSAAFGLVNRVSNLHHGITLLGRSRVESLVLSCAVSGSLPNTNVSPGLTHARFWQVCARRACLARHLARQLHPASEAESFTGALLQDVAVPVLASARADEYPQLLERALEDPATSLVVLEREALGYDHAEVGALIAEVWELPAELQAAIGDHHEDRADSAAEPAVRIAALLGYGETDDGRAAVIERCCGEFGIENERIEEMLEHSDEEAAQVSAQLA